MEIAREIQSSILPRSLPAIPGLHLAVRYVPMAAVAGDFYDVAVQDKNRMCILVADVSGHGVGAALIASMVKVAFAAQKHALSDPAHVLSGINRTLADKLENSFVTACCVVLDTDAGSVRYASAGHPPILLHRRTEPGIQELADNGMILGPFPEAVYTSTALQMEAGDRLILYTDGIVETRNPSGSLFGDQSFKTFIESHPHLSAVDFADTLLRHLHNGPANPPDNHWMTT
jgi:serine phosphatase RsbU (regulator of sigma subunit)